MREDAIAQIRRALDRHLASKDHPAAIRLAVDSVREGHIDLLDLYDLVLVPLLTDTGAQWQLGTTRIWEEHLASATARTIVESLYLDVLAISAEAMPTDRTALLACPPKEQHDLGLRMLADRFALAGWRAVFLGADTPVDEIRAAAIDIGADVVVLSASTHFNRVLLRKAVDTLRENLPRTQVLVGGPAFTLDRDWPAEEIFDHAALGLEPPRELHAAPEPPVTPAEEPGER